MAESKQTGDSWSKEAVIARAREDAKAGKTPAVQVFLAPDLGPEEVERAWESVKQEASGAVIGQFRKLSRSFSLEADPETIEKIASNPKVTAILPAEVEDILPKPRNVKRSKER
jgi:hypothetical protein